MFSHQTVANNSGKEVITDSFKIQRNNDHYGSAFIFLPCSLEKTINRYPSHFFEKSGAESVEKKNTDFMITASFWNGVLETVFQRHNNEHNLKPAELREAKQTIQSSGIRYR